MFEAENHYPSFLNIKISGVDMKYRYDQRDEKNNKKYKKGQ